jgi:release factor glutamine methyltransferase
VIDKDRKYLILNNDQNIKEKNLIHFQKLINKRSFREPIAYLTNKKHFWNYKFFVTKDTLIPRPDTELIVEQILKLTKSKTKMKILDIGVGSGCILLTILKERKNFYGVGVDISKKCLNISKINAKNLEVSSRVKFFKSDVDKFDLGKYDLIVSNPPYIKKFNLKYLEKDVVNFEPKLALDGGLDGLSEIRKVITKSSELIKKNGKFILEIGFDQKNKVINLLKDKGFYINSISKDLAKNDRCIVSTKI